MQLNKLSLGDHIIGQVGPVERLLSSFIVLFDLISLNFYLFGYFLTRFLSHLQFLFYNKEILATKNYQRMWQEWSTHYVEHAIVIHPKRRCLA